MPSDKFELDETSLPRSKNALIVYRGQVEAGSDAAHHIRSGMDYRGWEVTAGGVAASLSSAGGMLEGVAQRLNQLAAEVNMRIPLVEQLMRPVVIRPCPDNTDDYRITVEFWDQVLTLLDAVKDVVLKIPSLLGYLLATSSYFIVRSFAGRYLPRLAVFLKNPWVRVFGRVLFWAGFVLDVILYLQAGKSLWEALPRAAISALTYLAIGAGVVALLVLVGLSASVAGIIAAVAVGVLAVIGVGKYVGDVVFWLGNQMIRLDNYINRKVAAAWDGIRDGARWLGGKAVDLLHQAGDVFGRGVDLVNQGIAQARDTVTNWLWEQGTNLVLYITKESIPIWDAVGSAARWPPPAVTKPSSSVSPKQAPPAQPTPQGAPVSSRNNLLGIGERVQTGYQPGDDFYGNYSRLGFHDTTRSDCTWYAAAAVKAASGGKIDLNSKQKFPEGFGNARDWADNAAKFAEKNPDGPIINVDRIPNAGDIMQWSWIDKDNERVGHVAFIEDVRRVGDKWQVTVSEESATATDFGPNTRLKVGDGVIRWRRTITFDAVPGTDQPVLPPTMPYNPKVIHVRY